MENLDIQLVNIISALKDELNKIHIGRNQTDILELLKVNYYDNLTPISHIAIISTISHGKVSIEPYEKKMVSVIEKALMDSNLDINSQIHGNVINIFFPQMTLERRDKLIKLVKACGEKFKISLREQRRVFLNEIINSTPSETESKILSKKIENQISEANSSIEETVKNKIRDLTLLK